MKTAREINKKAINRTHGIFVFDFNSPSLKWVLQELKDQLAKQARKVICAITMDDVVSTKVTENENSKEFVDVEKLKRVINEKVQKSMRELYEIQVDVKELNILKFWKDNSHVGNEKDMRTKHQSQPKPQPSRRTLSKKKLSGEFESIACGISEVTYTPLTPKLTTKSINRSTYLLNLIKKRIEDHPTDGLDLYIVLIGSFDSQVYIDLLTDKVELVAITYVTSNLNEDFDGDETALNELRAKEITKNVFISREFISPMSKFLAKKNGDKIYSEFAWFLYDIDLKRRVHTQYLESVFEADVVENDSFIYMKNNYIPEFAPDEIIVIMYLKYLIDTVSSSLITDEILNKAVAGDIYEIKNEKNSLCFIEDQNNLLKLILASELNQQLYNELISFAYVTSFFHETTQTKATDCAQGNLSRETMSERKSTICQHVDYMEIFSKNVFFQKIDEVRKRFIGNTWNLNSDQEIASFCASNRKYEWRKFTGIVVIPNKICFRDYCLHVYPSSENLIDYSSISKPSSFGNWVSLQTNYIHSHFIRINSLKYSTAVHSNHSKNNLRRTKEISEVHRYSAESIEEPVIGYNLGDTQQQISFTEEHFHCNNVQLKFLVENWLYGSSALRINVSLFGNDIYHSRNSSSDFNNTIKVYTKNRISITLINHREKSSTQLTIKWANGLIISSHCPINKIFTVRQMSAKKCNKEEKRIFSYDGSILIFYCNKSVKILKPNGTIYKTEKLTRHKFTNKSQYQESKIDYKIQRKFAYDLDFIKNYENIIETHNYNLTTADGHSYVISNNKIQTKSHHFQVSESIDYATSNIYVTREDNTNIIYTPDRMECYFVDGTMVSTSIDLVMVFDISFYESLSFFNAENVPFQICRSIIDEIVDGVAGDFFINLIPAYTMQHTKYAKVCCSENKTSIINPEKIDISIIDDNVLISLEDKCTLIYNERDCSVSNESMNMKFKFIRQDAYLFTYYEVENFFKIYEKNQWIFETFAKNNNSPDHSQICLYSNRFGGYEKLMKNQVRVFTDFEINGIQGTCYRENVDELICIAEPFQSFEEKFIMTVADTGNFPNLKNSYFNRGIVLPSKPEKKRSSEFMTFRNFIKSQLYLSDSNKYAEEHLETTLPAVYQEILNRLWNKIKRELMSQGNKKAKKHRVAEKDLTGKIKFQTKKLRKLILNKIFPPFFKSVNINYQNYKFDNNTCW